MRSALFSCVRLSALTLPVFFALGCGTNGANFTSSIAAPATAHAVISGHVHGGQQPVSGATLQIYAVNQLVSGGAYVSTPLIQGVLPVSGLDGSFNISTNYTAPTTASHFYIVANGGSSSLGQLPNSSISMMAVLEGCTATVGVPASLDLVINEVSTMGAVLALQPFFAAPSSSSLNNPTLSTASTNYPALQDGFATAFNLVDLASGRALTSANSFVASDANSLMVYSMANTLAYCINSAPAVLGQVSTQCSNLATAATPTGTPLTALDTIQDAYYMVQNPTNNVTQLFNYGGGMPPFIGLGTAPSAFGVSVITSQSACQTTVNLGTAGNYGVLAYSGVTNSSTASDKTVISGSTDLIGSSPTPTETGFTFGAGGDSVGAIDNTNAGTAKGDLSAAFTDAAGRSLPATLPGDLSNLTFTPGLYVAPGAGAVTLNSGSVTLDAQGDPSAVFIFQMATTFTAAGGTQVLLVNGASAKNVFWQVGSSATLTGNAAWQGNVMAAASMSFGLNASLIGRALAENGAVTLLSNKITVP
jgi:hypothetical protein